jgi:uncharacterized protein
VESTSDAIDRRATLAHVVPFAAWLLLMVLPAAHMSVWNYVARTVIGMVLMLWLRPWRWYERPRFRHVPGAILSGACVMVLWVGAETPWFGQHWPALQDLYRCFAVGLPGSRKPIPGVPLPGPYDPAICGWSLSLVRLVGSAFVIAVIEEFFWRGFLYRFWQHSSFLKVDPGRLHAGAFCVTAMLFGCQHREWLAGILTGGIYGLLYVRTRNIWAPVIAHVTTNLLLGLYVLATGSYQFW